MYMYNVYMAAAAGGIAARSKRSCAKRCCCAEDLRATYLLLTLVCSVVFDMFRLVYSALPRRGTCKGFQNEITGVSPCRLIQRLERASLETAAVHVLLKFCFAADISSCNGASQTSSPHPRCRVRGLLSEHGQAAFIPAAWYSAVAKDLQVECKLKRARSDPLCTICIYLRLVCASVLLH